MSEERLQEIKDSISLQYKVQEANDLHSFSIFTDEEKELVDEIERLNKEVELLVKDDERNQQTIIKQSEEIKRLHSIIKEAREYIEENQEEHKYTDRGGFTYTEGHFLRDSDSLLEILDKVEEKK